jgi:hypothetical protein
MLVREMISINCENHTEIHEYVTTKMQIFVMLQRVVRIFTTKING